MKVFCFYIFNNYNFLKGGNIVSSIAVRKERDTSRNAEKYVERLEGQKLIGPDKALQGVVEHVMQTKEQKDVKHVKPAKTLAEKQAVENELASKALANVF